MEEQAREIIFHHQIPAQLRFSDVDRFGHVNNSVYFSLFDMSKEKYFMEVVDGDMFHKVNIVIANINASFLAPIYFPDEIVIQMAVTHLGNKSFTLTQRAVNIRTKELKCECRTVMVCINPETKESIPLPDDFRQKVKAFEGENLL